MLSLCFFFVLFIRTMLTTRVAAETTFLMVVGCKYHKEPIEVKIAVCQRRHFAQFPLDLQFSFYGHRFVYLLRLPARLFTKPYRNTFSLGLA